MTDMMLQVLVLQMIITDVLWVSPEGRLQTDSYIYNRALTKVMTLLEITMS